MILFMRFGVIWDRLMFDGQKLLCVVDGAVPVVVVTDRTVKHMIAEDSVEALPLSPDRLH
jgi:hypothetical protein